MRLGQLARKLDVKSDKIVSFLATEGVTLNSHPNSKVDDSLIEKIENHFQPTEATEEITTSEKPKTSATKTKEPKVAPTKEPETIEADKPVVTQELKIIGKIDLPDKKQIQVEVDGVVYNQETLDNKKKEELEAERARKTIEKEEKRKEEQEKKRIALEKRKLEEERKAMLANEKHNILTAEEEKKKAIILKAQQERERKLEERRKQLQKEHYLKNVVEKNTASTKKKKEKTITSTPSTKKVNEEVVMEQEQPQVHLNIFQKFIKWLNT
ncbi:MAG: hypothetical protein J5I47_09390 [Vicingus serpentipes]|nr:hypothetical protein [Vicingus serpentipes]